MANLGMQFDPSQVEDVSRDFDPLPVGGYTCEVIETDVQPTKSGSGTILKLVIKVIEGEHEGRLVWCRLNIQNENAQAQAIAQSQLKQLCEAIGVGAIQDSSELEFKPFVAKVGMEKAQEGRNPQNRVNAFKPYGASAPAVPARPAPTQAARPASAAARPAQAGGAARPWAR